MRALVRFDGESTKLTPLAGEVLTIPWFLRGEGLAVVGFLFITRTLRIAGWECFVWIGTSGTKYSSGISNEFLFFRVLCVESLLVLILRPVFCKSFAGSDLRGEVEFMLFRALLGERSVMLGSSSDCLFRGDRLGGISTWEFVVTAGVRIAPIVSLMFFPASSFMSSTNPPISAFAVLGSLVPLRRVSLFSTSVPLLGSFQSF